MAHKKRRKVIGILGICLTMLIAYATPFQEFASLPEEIRLFQGSNAQLTLSIPATALETTYNPDVISLDGLTIESKQPGKAELELKVGNIPIKKVQVNVLKDTRLYPGGHSIGVKLQSAGIMVVGHKLVEGESGVKTSPAEKSDIRIGDMIVKINGQKVKEAEQLGEMVHEAGILKKALQVEILRGKELVKVTVEPLQDKEDGQYKLGLYVRDSAAGVGTLTFYEPNSLRYGALGHVISDLDTQKPIVVGDGTIVRSTVTSVDKGDQGKPGSIRAIFPDERQSLGNIKKNTPFGIYGTLEKELKHPFYNKPLPIALVEQVKEGPAEILTVVEGEKIERFSIEIVNVIKQRYPSTKGMIIKVTDPRLIEKTGGIVQGMSGSPIIQDGRIVGAVTHVFVNDPTQGYGCFIEWMMDESGIKMEKEQGLKAS